MKKHDLDHLPQSIPQWLREYISPVTLKGDVPRLCVDGDCAPLRYIRFKGTVISLEFAPIMVTHELVEKDKLKGVLQGIPITLPGVTRKKRHIHLIPPDTITITLEAIVATKQHKSRAVQNFIRFIPTDEVTP